MCASNWRVRLTSSSLYRKSGSCCWEGGKDGYTGERRRIGNWGGSGGVETEDSIEVALRGQEADLWFCGGACVAADHCPNGYTQWKEVHSTADGL
ncbi:hypothetical protein NQZ68_027190 [Dissostichus eleginoides]|nr:hypothetical protein NQZ68_027190 [Dissostichus eleginoides]